MSVFSVNHKTNLCLLWAAIACAFLTGCSRPTGDFGRAAPNFAHDQLGPNVGKLFAHRREETVSLFARTDEELKLENVVWTIVRPVHTKDWISGSLIEGRRTRIFPNIDKVLDYRAYLFWHRVERFNSSEARWNRIISDIRADQGAVSPFYDQARVVYVIDSQRLKFLEETDGLEPIYRKNTRARLVENEQLMDLALRSLQFRYKAYEFAIPRMLLEFPSPRAKFAQEELERYKVLIERGGERGLPFIDNPELLSSRISLEANEDDSSKGGKEGASSVAGKGKKKKWGDDAGIIK
ncbi:MAG: hypothetical protein ABJK39_08295 [Hyphomicrobiales bacterium]